jgi:hypothetical protein
VLVTIALVGESSPNITGVSTSANPIPVVACTQEATSAVSADSTIVTVGQYYPGLLGGDRGAGAACGAIVTTPMLVAVTDHAAERFRQRVRGTLEAKTEIAARVARAHAAGRVESGPRGELLVRDLDNRDVLYTCVPNGAELVVLTLWEDGDEAAVPRRFTDALRRDDHRVRDRGHD